MGPSGPAAGGLLTGGPEVGERLGGGGLGAFAGGAGGAAPAGGMETGIGFPAGGAGFTMGATLPPGTAGGAGERGDAELPEFTPGGAPTGPSTGAISILLMRALGVFRSTFTGPVVCARP